MTDLRGFDLYYTDLDSLILDCVQPIVLGHRQRLATLYWERHYAGGPHLRLRTRGDAEAMDALSEELIPAAEQFFRDRPSPELESYSQERTAELLRREGATVESPDALEYRNNLLVPRDERSGPASVPTHEAGRLLESFQHDVMPLAGRILADRRPRREVMVRLFFLQGLVVAGDLRQGSVSWRSHWEGFAAATPSDETLDRIRSAYRSRRAFLRRLMLEVATVHEAGTWHKDPVLETWRELLLSYRRRTRETLTSGGQLTRQPATVEEAERFRAEMTRGWVRETAFLETFCADDAFLTSIQHEQRILVPRVLVNLLYVLLAAVGLSPIDKLVLCYFAHRTVEDHFGCDLREILVGNIEQVAGRRRG